jgi:hypothetical protein
MIGCTVAKVVVAPLANYSGLSFSTVPQGGQSSEFGQFHALEPEKWKNVERNGI